jgi:hypothetical protein
MQFLGGAAVGAKNEGLVQNHRPRLMIRISPYNPLGSVGAWSARDGE